ncbi:HAMP domain-containing protein [Deinococcus sp. KNUC1210]|uniref:HAMP domain-containing protein n=1 Tax=Deinococcus sp. KNUC1210 TaxID=2917691 RepID=UPI001EEFC096|nr:HAMP domain-containing protein [Deinococcus sp. KNUC1210]ULH14934.1 HAMP domain-containing protein [Deinococcus sp. KNUC1210]
MKYTVVIRQPVPENIQSQLTQELVEHFELNQDQASKLASRRSGRLMKPTSRKRAERLLEVFQSVGAQVNLEEVRDDTVVMPSVFPVAERSGMVGPAGAAFAGAPGSAFPGGAGVSALLDGGAFAATGGSVATLPNPGFPAAGAGDWMDGSSALTPLETELAPLAPQDSDLSAPGVVAAESAVPADSAWADFTGSLAGGGSAAPAAAAVVNEVAAPTGMMESDISTEAAPKVRRSSLARRVLVSTLLPLLLFTVVTLAFLVYALPRAQRQLIGQNAQAVAVAVGSNLDVTDQNTVYGQLDALIKRSSVGFVQVNLPDGTTFFRSKNAFTDGPLSEKIASWVQTHPDNSTFVESGSPADSYRYQLSLLEQVGAGDSSQAKALKTSIANPTNQESTTTTYVLSSINVTQNSKGVREVAQGVKSSAGTQLYSIVVGVPADDAFRLLTNTLLLVLGVALIAFIVASLLAVRTARLVVQPIERLVKAADAISMGDLERPVQVERNDEIGDLAQALERMRLSLEAAMERLRKRRSKA